MSPTRETLRKKKVSSFVDVELEEEEHSNKLIEPSKSDVSRKRISDFVDVELEEEDNSNRIVETSKFDLSKKRISNFVDVELEEENTSNRIIETSKSDLSKKRISDFVDVELEDEDTSNRLIVPTKRQLARKRLVEQVVKEEMTYKECVILEKGYRSDSKELVNRTVNYLKSLGLIESEYDIEHLTTLNFVNQSPEVSQRWISEIEEQKESLDSAVEVMRGQRNSIQSILDNVAKMEEQIKELKQKNKRIYDICMKAGKKVKGVDKHVRNRMLMDKLNNEQRIFELKSLVRKAKSQHLEDFSSLERMRKDVDEKQKAYDKKVREFKSDIGLTRESIDNLMIGIYNKFQDEILKNTKVGG